MDAEQFYEDFKAALLFLDVPWGKKDDVKISVSGTQIWLSANGKEAAISLPTKGQQ